MLETTFRNSQQDLGTISNLPQLLVENDQNTKSTLTDKVPQDKEIKEKTTIEDFNSEQLVNQEHRYLCHQLTGGAAHPGKIVEQPVLPISNRRAQAIVHNYHLNLLRETKSRKSSLNG